MVKLNLNLKTRLLALFGGILLLACSEREVLPPTPLGPTPTQSQLDWHSLEYYAFIHFSINTFTDKEWGFGDESPALFNPDSLDVSQWVSTFKEAGMKAIIITAKHHDGFCLWPSKFTDHSIKQSPYLDGKGDILRDLKAACDEYGLKLGIYLSPWDRNHQHYGEPEYIEYYRNQLTEVIENYGPIFEMWFDGANGGDGYYGGSNEQRTINGATYYDWPGTINMVRNIQNNILFFSDAGPDIRWVGNERGVAGKTNWNMISPDTLYAGKRGITGLLNTGSEQGNSWIPTEVDVSIRPGWFYHESQNSQVKTAEDLFEIYLTSIGRGSNLLLNVPPNDHGLISRIDKASLLGLKKLIDSRFANNLATTSTVIASNVRGDSPQFSASQLIDGNPDTYWATDDEVQNATIEITLEQPENIKYILLKERIDLGQRIKRFTIDAYVNGNWTRVAEETTIGYKRILPIKNLSTDKIRINLIESRACPVLSEIELY